MVLNCDKLNQSHPASVGWHIHGGLRLFILWRPQGTAFSFGAETRKFFLQMTMTLKRGLSKLYVCNYGPGGNLVGDSMYKVVIITQCNNCNMCNVQSIMHKVATTSFTMTDLHQYKSSHHHPPSQYERWASLAWWAVWISTWTNHRATLASVVFSLKSDTRPLWYWSSTLARTGTTCDLVSKADLVQKKFILKTLAQIIAAFATMPYFDRCNKKSFFGIPVTKVVWSRGFRTDDCLLHSKAQFHPFLELDKSALQLYTGGASLVLAWTFCWWWRILVYLSAMLLLEKLILIPRGQKHCLCISHVPGCCSSQVFLDFQHFQGRLFRDIFLSMRKRHFLLYQLIILKISQNVTCHSHYHIWASTTIIASAEKKNNNHPLWRRWWWWWWSPSLEEMPPDVHRPTPRPSKSIFHEMMVSQTKSNRDSSKWSW